MRRRLLLSTCLIAVAAVVVLGLPLGFVGSTLLHDRADMRLERRADAAAIRLARADARGEPLTAALVAGVLRADEALEVTSDGRTTLLGTRPRGDTVQVVSGDGGVVRVTLLAPRGAGDDDGRAVWLTVAGLGLAAVLAAAALAFVQARRLAQPLELLSRRVERVGQAEYDPSPVAGGTPEVEEVQLALNEADQRIAELVRRERQVTANASHQLRSPLTGLRMRLEELQRLATAPEAAAEADAALGQVDRLVATIEHLETFARQRDDQPDPVDAAQVVAAQLADSGWFERFARVGRALTVQVDPGAAARVREQALAQLVDVLVDNALQHGSGTTTLTATADGPWLRLAVADEGPAPAGAGALRIFDRGVGAGTGVGLDVARSLAHRAGGELRLLPLPHTSFEALLPGGRDGSAPEADRLGQDLAKAPITRTVGG